MVPSAWRSRLEANAPRIRTDLTLSADSGERSPAGELTRAMVGAGGCERCPDGSESEPGPRGQ